MTITTTKINQKQQEPDQKKRESDRLDKAFSSSSLEGLILPQPAEEKKEKKGSKLVRLVIWAGLGGREEGQKSVKRGKVGNPCKANGHKEEQLYLRQARDILDTPLNKK